MPLGPYTAATGAERRTSGDVGRIVFDSRGAGASASPKGKKRVKKARSRRIIPGLIVIAILVGGAAFYQNSARFIGGTRPIDLPDGLTAEHPGPMNWYQEIDGVYHHWIVQSDGTFEYVGVMKNDSETEIRAATTQKSMAEQRRRALMNAMKR